MMNNVYAEIKTPNSQVVNSLGRYLYKNLDGAFDFKKSSNMFDVYTVVLYQIPESIIKQYDLQGSYKDVRELNINISITTYQSKIRVNFIEMTKYETTLGHKTFDLKKFDSFEQIKDAVMEYLEMKLNKKYEGFEFLF